MFVFITCGKLTSPIYARVLYYYNRPARVLWSMLSDVQYSFYGSILPLAQILFPLFWAIVTYDNEFETKKSII